MKKMTNEQYWMRRNHARLMMTEVIVTSSKPALAKILKKSIVLTMETTLIIKHGN